MARDRRLDDEKGPRPTAGPRNNLKAEVERRVAEIEPAFLHAADLVFERSGDYFRSLDG